MVSESSNMKDLCSDDSDLELFGPSIPVAPTVGVDQLHHVDVHQTAEVQHELSSAFVWNISSNEIFLLTKIFLPPGSQ